MSLRPLLLTILLATGLKRALLFVALGTCMAVVAGDGDLDQLGPISFQPHLPVQLLVPVILAPAIALAHPPWPTPVVVRNARVLAARVLSYATATLFSIVVVGISFATAGAATGSAALRNVLLLSGLALVATAVGGSQFGWLPVCLFVGAGLLSGFTTDPWSIYGMLFHAPSSPQQLCASLVVYVLGLCVAAWNPRDFGYLRLMDD